MAVTLVARTSQPDLRRTLQSSECSGSSLARETLVPRSDPAADITGNPQSAELAERSKRAIAKVGAVELAERSKRAIAKVVA